MSMRSATTPHPPVGPYGARRSRQSASGSVYSHRSTTTPVVFLAGTNSGGGGPSGLLRPLPSWRQTGPATAAAAAALTKSMHDALRDKLRAYPTIAGDAAAANAGRGGADDEAQSAPSSRRASPMAGGTAAHAAILGRDSGAFLRYVLRPAALGRRISASAEATDGSDPHGHAHGHSISGAGTSQRSALTARYGGNDDFGSTAPLGSQSFGASVPDRALAGGGGAIGGLLTLPTPLIDVGNTNHSTSSINSNSVGLGGSRAANADAAALDDAVFRVWLREHPTATRDEVRREANRRGAERLASERAGRLRYLRQWKSELAELESRNARGDSGGSMTADTNANAEGIGRMRDGGVRPPRPPMRRPIGQVEIDAQRAAWAVFLASDVALPLAADPTQPNGGPMDGHSPSVVVVVDAAPGSGASSPGAGAHFSPGVSPTAGGATPDAAATSASTSPAAVPLTGHIPVAARASFKAFAGLASGNGSLALPGGLSPSARAALASVAAAASPWARRPTHRHEQAAAVVQCAWRVFQAKIATAWRRRRRAAETAAVVAAERPAQLAWEVAVAINEAEAQSQDQTDARMLALSAWRLRMEAAVAARRARKERDFGAATALRAYAATRIQARWRGLSVRRWVLELRHPHLAADRVAAGRTAAAVAIQRLWRGVRARTRATARRIAAVRIQTAFRQRSGALRLAALRRAHRTRDVAELRLYACRIVVRFFRSVLAKKFGRLLRFETEFRLLQRCGRGWLRARRAVAAQRAVRRDAAATKVQALVRGGHGRHVVVSGRRADVENEAEASIRDHAARIVARTVRRVVAVKRRARRARRTAAAVTVQRVWRGFAGRKAARARVASLDAAVVGARRAEAATAIQALARGRRARRTVGGSSSGGSSAQERSLAAPDASGPRGASARTVAHSTEEQQPQRQRSQGAQGDDSTCEPAQRYSAEIGGDAANTIRRFYIAFVRWPALRRFVAARAVEHAEAVRLRTEAALVIQRDFRGFAARRAVAEARAGRAVASRAVQTAEAAAVITAFMLRVRLRRRCAQRLLAATTASPQRQ